MHNRIERSKAVSAAGGTTASSTGETSAATAASAGGEGVIRHSQKQHIPVLRTVRHGKGKHFFLFFCQKIGIIFDDDTVPLRIIYVSRIRTADYRRKNKKEKKK